MCDFDMLRCLGGSSLTSVWTMRCGENQFHPPMNAGSWYNAGQAFEPLNKRTDWNWFCHGQSVERDTECSFGNRNLLHKKSLNKRWGAEQVPSISKATPH